jgi:hypothetical protein
MGDQVFPEGTVVKSKKDNKKGVVICDIFRVCGEGEVLVQWEGSSDTFGQRQEELEVLGLLSPKVDFEKCKDCIFYNGYNCLAYKPGRAGMLFGKNGNKRIPNRIYPNCQKS